MTTSDKEQLELAAKAAGLYEEWPEPDFGIQWNGEGLWCFGQGQGELWNPLTDDGDALRLAVKLGLCMTIDLEHGRETEVWDYGALAGAWEAESHNQDPYAATRRAIVRAAAQVALASKEIGKTL